MRIIKTILPALLAGVLLVGSGCLVRGARTYGTVAYTVGESPPPPRSRYVEYRPGWVYVDGYWAWNGGQWLWLDGYWERDRPGYGYVQGSWYVSGGRHHWKPGHWRRGGGGGYQYDRGHRTGGGGVVVREHAPVRQVQPAPRQKVKVKVKVREKNEGGVRVREHGR